MAAYPEALASLRNPTAAEISATSITYLDAVIEEVLRCGGTTPGLDREAMVDTKILGQDIPKGTTVLLLTQGPSLRSPAMTIDSNRRSQSYQSAKQSMTAHNRVWCPDSISDFNPERWIVPSSEPFGDDLGPRSSAPDELGLEFNSTAGPTLAFGLGIRGCWGRRLAYVELRLYFVLIVWNFYLETCPTNLSCYSAIAGITSKPKQCFVQLRKRN